MRHSSSRRTTALCFIFGAAALLLLSVLAIRLAVDNNRYRQAAAISSVRAVQELTESVEKVDTDLRKCVCSASPGMISALCVRVYGESTAAAQALAELPYANIDLENTAEFMNKVGDYALSISKSVYAADGWDADGLENLHALSKAASTLSEKLNELSCQLNDGTLNLQDAAAVERRLAQLTEEEDLFTGSSFRDIEADFPQLPTLIYDGPFSEHLQSRTAAMLANEDTVNRAQAQDAAAAFLGVPPQSLTYTTIVEGEIPCSTFVRQTDDDTVTVEVTRQGGHILSMSHARAIGPETLTHEEGAALAKAFLEEQGIRDMEEHSFIDRDNSLTVNFAAVQDGVLCYPDLIKVEVALDNGEVIGYEAAGYLMNHIRRENISPAVGAKDAWDMVSPELTVEGSRLTIIPTEGKNEKLCWEFRCRAQDSSRVLVYIGADSGREEQILLVLEDESGMLTQ